MVMVYKEAQTPLGLWRYFPHSGMNVLDTDCEKQTWRPLVVSIAITGRCYKGCHFCYASSSKEGTSSWRYSELVDFIVDLDRNGVFSVTLGGGEPTLWQDDEAGKSFYDLIADLEQQVSLSLTFTTSAVPKVKADQLPNIALRLSCHYPWEVKRVLSQAKALCPSKVGINLLLWRSHLDECRQAIYHFLSEGFNDILLLTMQPAGFGVQFADESLSESEVASFINRLELNSVRLTACQKPPRFSANADMGCGANDWFVSITEHKIVKSCSFVDSGHPLTSPTYQALLAASQHLPRLPCYRSYKHSALARMAGI